MSDDADWSPLYDDPPFPEPPAQPDRPEWAVFKMHRDAYDEEDQDHFDTLAGFLRPGDVILWGDGEWRAITAVDQYDENNNGESRLLWDQRRFQALSPACVVRVRQGGEQ